LLGPVVKAPKSKRPSVARELVRRYAADKRPIPGFGHHIHRDQDPRVTRLLEIAREAGAKGDYLAALALLERAIKAELKKPLVTNISAAIAAVLGEAGLPAAIIRGIVLTARCAGLAGHLCEELENPIAGAMWKAAERAVSYEPT
jgi:citrate synthase